MRLPITQVLWCFCVEVVMMGGGLDKGISINRTLIRFPACFGFKRLLLMQQCSGMWIVRCSKWNLCQHLVREQGTEDSCQRQHIPRAGKVVHQSWALKRKCTGFSLATTTLRGLSDRHKHIHPSAQMHRHREKKEMKKYLRGLGWSDHWMSWLSSYNQFYFDFKTSWPDLKNLSLIIWSHDMFFLYFTDFLFVGDDVQVMCMSTTHLTRVQ